VEYSFFPKGNRTHRAEALGLPDGPVEPDGLLRFDARIRKWIDDMQKKP
jgi:hypothetical protein